MSGLFKNTASQKLELYVYDSTTGLPKTGDAGNLTAYVNIDNAGVNALGDTSATEIDSTNAKGFYLFDLTQGETNGDKLHFTGKSTTANMVVVGRVIYTRPTAFGLVAGAAGGLFIAGTNAATTVTTAFTTTFTGNLTGSVASVTGNVGGNVVGSVASVTGNVGGNVVGSVASVTGNVGGNVVGSVASVTGNVSGSVGSVVGNVGGSVASVTSVSDKTGYVLSAAGSAALTEAYATKGATVTLNQAIYMILQMLMEKSAATTTLTVNGLDGATPKMTFTTDSATAPTSITRAT